MLSTLARGKQLDFHQPATVVLWGEDRVLVSKARWVSSAPAYIKNIRSFLGVQPGDVVEMAADVVDLETQQVLYARSIHKETAGIYDAWDPPQFVHFGTKGFEVVITCRVNGANRLGEGQSLFEGLVRVEFMEGTCQSSIQLQ